mmetsp:Transcript_4873/g.10463  ORF Transcript_4873/g.10463 Transcript_4873/m.10463 type:complete len:159 (+) Transcript_4873:343-819(+)
MKWLPQQGDRQHNLPWLPHGTPWLPHGTSHTLLTSNRTPVRQSTTSSTSSTSSTTTISTTASNISTITASTPQHRTSSQAMQATSSCCAATSHAAGPACSCLTAVVEDMGAATHLLLHREGPDPPHSAAHLQGWRCNRPKLYTGLSPTLTSRAQMLMV